MKEHVKYAYIKLTSGEEIFAEVEEFVDEDKTLLLLILVS